MLRAVAMAMRVLLGAILCASVGSMLWAHTDPFRCLGGTNNLAPCTGSGDCPNGACAGATATVVGGGLFAFRDAAGTIPVIGTVLECETIYYRATLNYVANPLPGIVGAAFEGGAWRLRLPNGTSVDITPALGVPCIGGATNDPNLPGGRGLCAGAPSSIASVLVPYTISPADVVAGKVTASQNYGDPNPLNPNTAYAHIGPNDTPGVSATVPLPLTVRFCTRVGTACLFPDRCDVASEQCIQDPKPPTTICRTGSGDLCDPDESCTGVPGVPDCPPNIVAPPTTVCNPGSGDSCDPDESCTGVPGQTCPADRITPVTTICRPGSGDLCDPDESCTGIPDLPCPPNVLAPPTTICNPGSGDLCDPDESCTGVPGQTCPADRVAPATTTCRPGSGDVCDPDESCPGIADTPCLPDVVAPPTTVCNPGSGDACDPDESCTGLPGQSCPADRVTPVTTTCRTGSGDVCDPDESCTGVADVPCPPDLVAPPTTVCNPGSGDLCDPDESCTGVPGQTCPPDRITPVTTTCRPGSGDSCDPDESCTGVADAPCPPNVLAPPTTICNPGSGDVCDPDESCTGVPGQTCPPDRISPVTTSCRPGSGDLCDPDESCTGVADAPCPPDLIAPPTTVCNPGSGDSCDPDESCTGVPGQSCPPDRITPVTTICRTGSGDVCDPDESCTGVADRPCPPNVIAPPTTVCNPGSGDVCDPDESCSGVPGQACPADRILPPTSICRPGSGDACDPGESCPGIAGGTCPPDVIAPPTTTCRTGSGDLCDPDESCTGVSGQACPPDRISLPTKICRPGSGDLCNPDEFCTGRAGELCPPDRMAPDSTPCTAREHVPTKCAQPGCEAGVCVTDHVDGSVSCDDGDACTTDTCNPDRGCEHTTIADCGEFICRPPTFWGNFADRDPMKVCSQDVTGAVVSLGGGAIFVCGECLVNAGDGISTLPPYDAASLQEALCTRIVAGQDLDRQLARELTAVALNCIISGFGPRCVGSSIEELFADCNAVCDKNLATPANRTATRCLKELNCFNNGSQTDNLGRCVGTTHCAARVFPLDLIFPGGTLCTANPGQPKLGPPGSEDECATANNTTCAVVPPNESQCRLQGILRDSCP